MLESWYNNDTRYPSVAQSQAYANALSQAQPQQDAQNVTGSSRSHRGPIQVTAQNVSHWFQNRRRKDNHPEIEEKRVKKRSARMKRQSNGPLDLTQQQQQQHKNSELADAAAAPAAAGSLVHSPTSIKMELKRRDSDDEAGPLFIAEAEKEDTSDFESHYSH